MIMNDGALKIATEAATGQAGGCYRPRGKRINHL